MRILAQKINTIQDVDSLKENDTILIISNNTYPYWNMWCGILDKNKYSLTNVIFSNRLPQVSNTNYVYAPLYSLFKSVSIYKLLNETSIKLIKMAKSNISMFKLLKENNLI